MKVVSSRIFSENPSHYLNLANTESVVIENDKKLYWITPQPEDFENLSPSGDPYWADPRNVAELVHRDKLSREGKNPIVATLKTSEDIRVFLGLNEDEI